VPEQITIEGDLRDVLEYYLERGWSDGLPIVPPTEEAVAQMLRYTDRDPGEVIGTIAPSRAKATVHSIAVNAVMAGCRPEYLPVVLAGVAAVADPVLNISALQATTNPVSTLIVVNGPIARELNFNAKGNCFGPGWQANATVGRAVRMCLLSIGEGTPQTMDKSTQGSPGKFTMCIAENEEDSPWAPFHVDRGFDHDVSTVTAFSATGTQNVMDLASKSALGILGTFASSLATVGAQNMWLGGGPLLAICPEHADMLAAEGFSKSDVKRHLYETARLRVMDFSPEIITMIRHRRGNKFA